MNSFEKAELNHFNEPIEFEQVTTFREWFKYWYWSFREQNIKTVTKAKYCINYNEIYQSALGSKGLKDIKRLDVQGYISNYGKNRSKQTVLDHMQCIRSAFNDALTEGVIKVNPTVNVKLVYKELNFSPIEQKKLRDEKKWLEIDEYQKLKYFLVFALEKMLLDFDKPDKAYHSDATYYVMIFVAMKTGARVAEILGLTRSDIDFDRDIITIDKTWDYKYLTGFSQTKNYSSIREIQIDKETTDILSKYLDWLDNSKKEMAEETLFILKKRKIYVSTINNRLYVLLEKLDIEKISFHKLRHTHASYLIAKEIPLQVVAKRLGHTDTTMIAKVYGHLLKETENSGNRRILELI